MSLKYRSDIDGIRCLAILPVVIFHAFPHLIPGGFIGVDVFFVISGYLISSIIYQESRNGTFSYYNFYYRRIKRIFPALLTVLFFCMVMSYIYMLPSELKTISKHIIAGVFFSQNINLFFESGYFDTSTELKPLMHLWSLGVEEQFYIFFPIIVLFLAKKRRALFIAISCIMLLSLIYCIKLTFSDISAAYYLPLTRMWELMIGCIIAFPELKKRIKISKVTADTLSALGLCGIISSCFMIDSSSFFPGYIALLPVTSTAMLILSGEKAIINKYILSNKLIVFVGLISYPLYLWHWPIISYMKIIGIFDGRIVKILAVALGFILASLTYLFIEKPIKKTKDRKKLVLSVGTATFIIVGVSTLSFFGKIKPINNDYLFRDIIAAKGEWEYPKGLTDISINNVHMKGLPGEKYTLYYGDSNMEEYSSRIVKLKRDNPSSNRGILFLTSSGCLPVGNLIYKDYDQCNSMPSKLISVIKSGKIDRVVISALWYKYFIGTPSLEIKHSDGSIVGSPHGINISMEKLSSLLEKVRDFNVKVYLILTKPIGQQLDPANMIVRKANGNSIIRINDININEFMGPFLASKK
ncbi:acyltransferase family protein [Escherichia coli]